MEIVFLAGRILRFCATKSPFFDALVAFFLLCLMKMQPYGWFMCY